MPYHHLTFDERNVIYRMSVTGKSQAEIARCLGRSPSTISRERKRNISYIGKYFSATAQAKANVRHRLSGLSGDTIPISEVQVHKISIVSPDNPR